MANPGELYQLGSAALSILGWCALCAILLGAGICLIAFLAGPNPPAPDRRANQTPWDLDDGPAAAQMAGGAAQERGGRAGQEIAPHDRGDV